MANETTSDTSSSAVAIERNQSESKDDGNIEKWDLPSGAAMIIRQIAAEQILHELLDQCGGGSGGGSSGGGGSNSASGACPKKKKSGVDFTTIEKIVREFPATCRRWYDFQIDTRDQCHRVRSLLPLMIVACLQPPLSVVQAIYTAYPPAISAVDPAKGATALLYACSFEATLDVVQFLIHHYPQAMGMPRLDGVIPLSMACSYRASRDVVERLIREYPQGISTPSLDGWYPIHAAVACGAPLETVQTLYQAFPPSITDINNPTRSTALHLACSKRAGPAVVEFLLIQSPESARLVDAKRMTPWFWAVYSHSVTVLQLFLRHVPNLPLQSPEGINLLHYAARHNSAEVVQFLSHKYPNLILNQTRYSGMTPLHVACRRGKTLDVVQTLVQKDPRCLWIRNQRGKLPIQEAQDARSPANVLQFLANCQEHMTQQAQQQQQHQQQLLHHHQRNITRWLFNHNWDAQG